MFDIIGKRRWFYLFSLLIMIPGIIFILLTPLTGGKAGLKFSIDFTGGTVWEVHFERRDAVARRGPGGHDRHGLPGIGRDHHRRRPEIRPHPDRADRPDRAARLADVRSPSGSPGASRASPSGSPDAVGLAVDGSPSPSTSRRRRRIARRPARRRRPAPASSACRPKADWPTCASRSRMSSARSTRSARRPTSARSSAASWPSRRCSAHPRLGSASWAG